MSSKKFLESQVFRSHKFSRKLSPAVCIYSNQELLAVKLVLEEWHHWLEGTHHPFTFLINHKNL